MYPPVSRPRFMRRCLLPSPESLRLVPLLQRYYEALRPPDSRFAALRFLRSAIPRSVCVSSPCGFRRRADGSSRSLLDRLLPSRWTSPTFHAPRSSGSAAAAVPSWVQHAPPGRRQYAMKSYIFGFSAEVLCAWFSAQLSMEVKLTSISLETLVGRDSRPNCLLKNELRRYEPRG